jgi:hypothetical protein
MKYLKLDKNYDLYITMTWSGDTNHGISGHLYEIIEYFILLKDHMKIGILICEDMSWDTIEKALHTKYDLDKSVIDDIKKDTFFEYRPKYVIGKNILFVDGGFTRTMLRYGVVLSFKNIFSFRCSNKDYHYNLPYKNITLLQDNRVYNDEDNKISINYKKKIKFDIFKKSESIKTKTALLYITSNCRKICDDYLLDVMMQYKYENYIILTNENEKYKKLFSSLKNVTFPELPVDDIFKKFDAYIYTPTHLEDNKKIKSFDCSPRFIAECKFYNKQIIYHGVDDNYINIDTGLKYRKYDIEYNFKSIFLNKNDDIIKIIKDRI